MIDDWPIARLRCFYCQDIAALGIVGRVFAGRGNKRVSDMDNKVCDMTPCSKCAEYMKQGVILITIDDSKSNPNWHIPPKDPDERKVWMPNPWRTGGWFVVSDDYIRKVFKPKSMADNVLKHRWTFLQHEAAKMLGLIVVNEKGEEEPVKVESLSE